jgi:hypothetical protein
VADQGTLFLDEIGDLAPGLQAKLLRVLQQRSFERLGSNTPVNVNIRLVCATHRNLEEMVDQGKFRSDLYYRLNVVQIHIPPLRERANEIAHLSQHFLARFAKQFNKNVVRFSSLCLGALEEYSWPGNVRELENVVQHAVVLAEGPSVEVWHLPKAFHTAAEIHTPTCTYEEEIREFKRRLILRTLNECDGNKTETARRLGIVRTYLHRLISQLQIETESRDLPEEGGDTAPFTLEPFPLGGRLCSERPAAVKGAPLLCAAKPTLDGEDRSATISQEGKAPVGTVHWHAIVDHYRTATDKRARLTSPKAGSRHVSNLGRRARYG